MTYEYVCTSCGAEWETEQSISEAPLKRCPHCRKDAAKRQISGGNGFILKGGGWYADLYASSGAKPERGEDAGRSESKGSEGASEAAPSSKTEGASKDTAAGKGSSKDATASKGTAPEGPRSGGTTSPASTTSKAAPAASGDNGSGAKRDRTRAA